MPFNSLDLSPGTLNVTPVVFTGVMAGQQLMVTQAYRYALDPTPAQQRALASFAGAARVAYNRMLAFVKDDLELGRWERQLLGGRLQPAQGWSLAALRRTWNANKDRWAPWWQE
ncbi:MAG TPA: helix-turn-helix domain-containing protein, partial [Euzebya sp.]|nr:helix-turn-helix domain-containing protein [Euzebya sp.]